MDIRRTSLLFAETEGEGPATAEAELAFPRDVLQVTAGITGYSLLFEDEDDHHVGRVELEVRADKDEDDADEGPGQGRLRSARLEQRVRRPVLGGR